MMQRKSDACCGRRMRPGVFKDVNAKLRRQPDPFLAMIHLSVRCAVKSPLSMTVCGKGA